MKIYRILGNKGNTTVPWQIRDAMDLRASDVISFEYGSFGEDVIVLRRELCADGGLGDCEYPCNPDAPDGGEFADELEDEPNEDLEVKALLRAKRRSGSQGAVGLHQRIFGKGTAFGTHASPAPSAGRERQGKIVKSNGIQFLMTHGGIPRVDLTFVCFRCLEELQHFIIRRRKKTNGRIQETGADRAEADSTEHTEASGTCGQGKN